METALTLLALALILLPGWVLWLRLTGPRPSQEVAITGLTLSAAAWPCAAAAAAWRLPRRPPRIRLAGTLALLALGAAAIRFAPVLVQDFPKGWNPYFHLMVVRLIEQSGAQVFTLSTFE